jgi:hypothetical protein
MAINTDKLGLILPDRGEFPGEWDTPLNDNLEKIDLTLWKAYTHNPTDIQPGPEELVGSSWYKVTEQMLMLKGANGIYHSANKHIHGSSLDIPKVVLTDGAEVSGVLPSWMVQYSGLNAEKLGGKFGNEYVSIGGTGIQVYVDQATGLGAARILPVPNFADNQEFNRVRVDISGRVTAGTLANTLSGVGITDGVTINYANATFATIESVNNNTTNLTSTLQGWTTTNFANISGNAGHGFDVFTNGSEAGNAVSVSWAQSFLAARGGNALQTFLVGDAGPGTKEAVSRLFGDTIYASFGHNHNSAYVNTAGGSTMTGTTTLGGTAIFNILGTLNISSLVNANGGITLPSGQHVTVASTPTLDGHLTRKKYVDDRFTADAVSQTQGDSRYALKNGDATKLFYVENAVDPGQALNQRTGDIRYATNGNLTALQGSVNASLSNLDNKYVQIAGSPKVSSGRMGIMRSRLSAGVPDILTANPDKSVDLFASATEPCIVAVPGGVTQFGTATFIVYAAAAITDIFETNSTKIDATYATKADLVLDAARYASEGIYLVTADESHAGATYLYTRNRNNDAWGSTVAGSTVAGTPLPASTTIYAMLRVRPIDFAQGVEYTAIAPTYSYTAPGSPVDRQFWFNLNDECFFRYNTSLTTWEKYPAAMMATVTTDGASAPTSIVMYDSKLTYDFKVPTPTANMQVPNKKYVDDSLTTGLSGKAALAGSGAQAFATAALTSTSVTSTGEVAGPQFKVTPEGGYAVKFINLTGAATVKGNVTHLLHPTITEAGDTSNQLSAWTFYNPSIANTNLGTVYWELLWTLAGQITTINIFKDLAKTQLVASGTRSGNTTAGTITLTAQNASGLTGSVTITGGANPTQDNDAANTLFIGVDGAIGLEEPNDTMPMGIIYEAGIANGSDVWVVVAGKADVLLDDAQVVTRGGVLLMSATTAGRADFVPQGTVLTTTQHFEELGHTLQGVPAGTNRLVRAILHWN